MNWRRDFGWIVLGTCALMVGCGPSYGGRLEVRGTIKLKGKPLDSGIIDFTPLAADGATKEGAPIINGEYKIVREHGLAPGTYRVCITAGDGRTPSSGDKPPGPTGANIVSKDRVPPEYNTNSKQDVEVKAKGSNVFSFDIP